MIFNLLSNAVKFTPAGGAVDVSAARVDGEVRVSVADTGPGLAAEDHERIFEEFQQTEAGAEQREGPASASRCRSGSSSCTAAGSGSTASSARAARSCSRCPRGLLAMAGERVLVVEDNEKNMKLFRDVLTATGYRTLEATTGEQAVELATEHGPDLVLMDIQLPDIDGVEALAPAARRRAHGLHPGARADGPGDAGRPRALPGRGLRRLPLEAA